MIAIRRPLLVLLLGAAFGVPVSMVGAWATPVSIFNPFVQLYHISDNTVGLTSGNRLRFGAVVAPSGGTIGTASTINTATNATVIRPIPFVPSIVTPNFFSNIIGDGPNIHGPWTLSFQNGADSASTVVSLPAGAQQAPFVQNLTVSGSGTNPTYTWTPPANTQVDGYQILIYDKSLTTTNKVAYISPTLLPSQTSFTVPTALAGGLSLDPSRTYTVEIRLAQTKDSTANLNPANVFALSSIFSDFKPLPSSAPVVNLPVVLGNGSFQFNMTVTPGQTYYIDPTVATGYVYKTAPGNPNFASVILPTIQSALYDLSFLDHGSLVSHLIAGGMEFFFPDGGVDTFTVKGIDPSLMLDPSNPTAFITGLTFVSAGLFTGTQTPIVTDAPVPLPAALPLFVSGLGLLGIAGWRKRRRVAA